MKYILRNKILFAVILLVVVLFPNIIAMPQQSRTENIITAIGIDKNDYEYEVFVQYVIPYAESEKNSLKIMSGKGVSVGEAIENMDMEYGKNSGFAHCRALIFNDKACEENLAEILDYLLRIKTNTNDILLVNTRDSAGKVLECVGNLDNEFYTIINSNGIANDQRKYQDLKSIGDYYNSQLGESKSIAINLIDVEENDSQSEADSSGGEYNDKSGGAKSGGSSSNTQSDAQKIKNHGELIIIKNGKKITSLTQDESKALSWFDNQIKESSVVVKNFTDGLYKNADLNFYIYNKRGRISTSFVDGKPKYTYHLKVYLRTAQIIQNGTKMDVYEVNKKKLSDKLVYQITENIRSELFSAENHFKSYDYDVVKCNEDFHKFHPYKYADYLKTLSYGESFIKNVDFEYKIEIIQRL